MLALVLVGCGRLGFDAQGNNTEIDAPTQDTAGSLLPIHHWKFDETGGSSAADSAGNIVGMLAGGATWGTGTINGAVDLDGTGAYVDLGNQHPLGTGAATISAWVFTRSIPAANANFSTIISFGFAGLSCGVQDFSTFRYGCSHDGFTMAAQSDDNALILGQWQLVTFVRNASGRITIYVDRIQSFIADQDAGQLDVGAIGSAIGAEGDDQQYPFDGLIDDVRLFDRALTASEISQL